MKRRFVVRNGLLLSGALLLVSPLVALTACAPGTLSEEQPVLEQKVVASQLAHHRWVLKTIDGVAVLSNPVGTYSKGLVPELDFGEAQHVGGFAGCNQFSGQFELNDLGQFRVEKLATTMKMCPDDAMHLEQRYAHLLNQWSEITVKGAVLSLKQGEQEWLFNQFDWVQ